MIEHKAAWFPIADTLPQLDRASLIALRSGNG
jgi:hypothetical protein